MHVAGGWLGRQSIAGAVLKRRRGEQEPLAKTNKWLLLVGLIVQLPPVVKKENDDKRHAKNKFLSPMWLTTPVTKSIIRHDFSREMRSCVLKDFNL